MANVIIRRINLTGTFQPLAAERTIGTFTFFVPSGADSINLQADDDQNDVPLGRGDAFTLERVNLQDIHARGGLSDYLVVIGATTK